MKTRWGIISTANIGVAKVVPAIMKAANCEVVAIASRSLEQAKKVADELGILKAYGSYDELLNDGEIDVVYNPLPNHLHVSYTLKALAAGKHVLCEKPIGLTTNEALLLKNEMVNYPRLKVMEAFMYRFHPQWLKVKGVIDEGGIGEIKVVQSFFSYFNNNPENIRNRADIGGGALMDIGCYCVSFPRFLFGTEPERVVGLIDRDPKMLTDRITSAMLDFGNGLSSSFTCSTQLMPFQRVQIVGTTGRIEVEIPVNAPLDKSVNITLFTNENTEGFTFGPTDQYQLQAEAFANSINNNLPVPTPIDDAIDNMRVIDAIFESGTKGKWMLL